MKLLIIEDEYRLADMLCDYFSERGYDAVMRHDGEGGLAEVLSGRHDAVILDLMLPKKDGYEILESMHRLQCHTPVLILTAMAKLPDKLKGFAAGAQDYLTKPFEIEELEARIRILSQKGGRPDTYGGGAAGDAGRIAVSNLVLEKNTHNLCNTDTNCSTTLSAKEYTLMRYFMGNAGQLLSKEQITVHIWGYDADTSYNHEEVYISFLRKKLNYLKTNVTIETVRGSGYRLRVKK